MHVNRRFLFQVFTLLFVSNALFFVANVDATTFPRLTTRDLVTKSDAIAIGKCVSSASKWVDGRIETEIVLSVDRYLKGDMGVSLTLTKLGGNVGDIGMVVPGTPKFTPDEEVLVYISRSQSGQNTVTGWALGKFSISRDSESGEKVLFSNPDGVNILENVDGKAVEVPARAQRFRLESYVQEVNTILGKEGGIELQEAGSDEVYKARGKQMER